MPNGTPELSPALSALADRVADLDTRSRAEANRLAMVVFSGEFDRVLAAFLIATGAAASGVSVTMFFTFWATAALRRTRSSVEKDLTGRLFGWILPRGSRSLPMSKLNLAGLGPAVIRQLMRRKGIAPLDEMIFLAGELGVEVRVCEMSMGLLGLRREELVDYPGLSTCGVATFIETATSGRVSLFI
ncbi:MAG: DsrE/DsrF/DrsH-like family protein [Polyangiaceae bacterium]|nr:DsrE/DsrF/DrsH-like family protein [Polyangiaceae bacterium]